METLITERVNLLKRVNKRLGIKYKADVENFDFIKFANSFLQDPNNPNADHN
jgi:hypothetical protein